MVEWPMVEWAAAEWPMVEWAAAEWPVAEWAVVEWPVAEWAVVEWATQAASLAVRAAASQRAERRVGLTAIILWAAGIDSLMAMAVAIGAAAVGV